MVSILYIYTVLSNKTVYALVALRAHCHQAHIIWRRQGGTGRFRAGSQIVNHQFVWVDIPVADLDRAIAFYSAVLADKVSREGGPGFFFGLLPHAGSSVSGCLYRPGPENAPSQQGPLVYLNASGRLREAVQAAQDHGGYVVQSIHQIGEHGWRAIVVDSEGNRIALHAPKI